MDIKKIFKTGVLLLGMKYIKDTYETSKETDGYDYDFLKKTNYYKDINRKSK